MVIYSLQVGFSSSKFQLRWFLILFTHLMQHVDKEARFARQKTLAALQRILEAGLQNVG